MSYLARAIRRDGAHPLACSCARPALLAAQRRITEAMSRRGFLAQGAAVTAAALGIPSFASAQQAPVPAAPPAPLAIRNVRVFDGRAPAARPGLQVLVRGPRIEALLGAADAVPEGTRVVDGGGRILMPGLIDAHWHALMASVPLPQLLTEDVGFLHLAAAAEAERTLLRGFTTVRDVGGPSFGLKRAIDLGMMSGPRIFPCGATISQTAGHGDFRMRHELPRREGDLSYTERIGAAAIADSPDEVRRCTREQLLLGASQVKMMGGGGISSLYDPLDATQFTAAEMRAAVEAAEDWGTYVCAHVYTPKAIARALDAGVRSIEHGQLTDEDSVRRIVDKGAWWSLQPFVADPDAPARIQDEASRRKGELVYTGTDRAYELAIRHKARVAFGTDILFAPRGATAQQSRRLAMMARWYSPVDALRQATAANGELLAMSGERNPYPGKLGVIEAGAWADLLVVDGDPLGDLKVLADPGRTLRIVMKDGRIHKNTL